MTRFDAEAEGVIVDADVHADPDCTVALTRQRSSAPAGAPKSGATQLTLGGVVQRLSMESIA